jgi:hypothetical protein
MARTVTKVTVYWDAQDSSNEGWAYRLSDEDGDIESGSLDSISDDLDVAIDEAISISGLDLTADMFAREPHIDGGYAFWNYVE